MLNELRIVKEKSACWVPDDAIRHGKIKEFPRNIIGKPMLTIFVGKGGTIEHEIVEPSTSDFFKYEMARPNGVFPLSKPAPTLAKTKRKLGLLVKTLQSMVSLLEGTPNEKPFSKMADRLTDTAIEEICNAIMAAEKCEYFALNLVESRRSLCPSNNVHAPEHYLKLSSILFELDDQTPVIEGRTTIFGEPFTNVPGATIPMVGGPLGDKPLVSRSKSTKLSFFRYDQVAVGAIPANARFLNELNSTIRWLIDRTRPFCRVYDQGKGIPQIWFLCVPHGSEQTISQTDKALLLRFNEEAYIAQKALFDVEYSYREKALGYYNMLTTLSGYSDDFRVEILTWEIFGARGSIHYTSSYSLPIHVIADRVLQWRKLTHCTVPHHLGKLPKDATPKQIEQHKKRKIHLTDRLSMFDASKALQQKFGYSAGLSTNGHPEDANNTFAPELVDFKDVMNVYLNGSAEAANRLLNHISNNHIYLIADVAQRQIARDPWLTYGARSYLWPTLPLILWFMDVVNYDWVNDPYFAFGKLVRNTDIAQREYCSTHGLTMNQNKCIGKKVVTAPPSLFVTLAETTFQSYNQYFGWLQKRAAQGFPKTEDKEAKRAYHTMLNISNVLDEQMDWHKPNHYERLCMVMGYYYGNILEYRLARYEDTP